MSDRKYIGSQLSDRFLIRQLRQRISILERLVKTDLRVISVNDSLLIDDNTIEIDTEDVTITLFDLNSISDNPTYNISNSSGGVITIQSFNSQVVYLPSGSFQTVILQDGESLTIQRTNKHWRSL